MLNLTQEEQDLIKQLEQIKDNKTQVEIRVMDLKNMRVAYKTLTVKEVVLLIVGVKLDWRSLNKED
jgi:hypothetical protein